MISETSGSKKKKTAVLIVLAMAVLLIAVYWPIQHYDFLKYDDYNYVVLNYRIQSGLSLKGVAEALSDTHTGNWHPLTMLSHFVDWQLYYSRAGGHHWTSLIIHLLNTVLLFLFLNAATGALGRSALVAALFAVHPINVESVAWIAERKNVLSTFFWLTTLLLYLHYVRHGGWLRYGLVALSFALGLAAKPMLVTLPFVLLLLDFWPLDRTHIHQAIQERNPKGAVAAGKVKWSFLFYEKLPLLALSAGAIAVTLYTQHEVDTVASLDALPPASRIANAVVSYGLYIRKLLWPVDLALFYPHWDIQFRHILLAALLLIAVTIALCASFRKRPYLPVGWFWYLGTLFPVIGIVQVGAQSMADRYAYVPFIGLFIIASWGLYPLLRKLASPKVVAAAAILTVGAFALMTVFQVAYWRDTFTIFARTLNVTKNNFVAHYMLAGEFLERGKTDQAIEHYKIALALDAQKYVPLFGLGQAFLVQGQYDKAVAAFRQVIALQPASAEAYDHLCQALEKMGRREEAVREYRRILKRVNDHPGLYNNFGNLLARQGLFEEAIRQYDEVLRLRPTDAGACYNAGLAYVRLGEMDKALESFKKAIALRPEYAGAYMQASLILKKKGLPEEAKRYEDFATGLRTTSRPGPGH